LQYLSVVGGAALLDWDRLGALLQGSSAADDPLVDGLEAITTRCALQIETAVPSRLLPAVESHLGLMTGALRASQPGPRRRRLLSLAGETSVLAGWLSYLRENRGDARRSWAYALELARESGDARLMAITLAMQRVLHSTIPNGGRYGSPARALAFLDQAETRLGRASSPHARVMILAKRAEEHAAAGDAAAAWRDLDLAEDLVERLPFRDDGLFAHWDAARIAGYRGSCAMALGRPREAVAVLETALAATSPALRGQHCAVTTDLAAAYAEQGEVERSCRLLTASLDAAQRSGLEELVLRIVGARRHLGRWQESAHVRQLDERLLLVHA